MIQKQFHHQNPTLVWVADHRSQKPTVHCPAHTQFSGLETVSFREPGGPESLLGHSVDFCVSQAALLVWECLSAVLIVYIRLGREERRKSGQFQGLPDSFALLTSCKELASQLENLSSPLENFVWLTFSSGWRVLSQRKLSHNTRHAAHLAVVSALQFVDFFVCLWLWKPMKNNCDKW